MINPFKQSGNFQEISMRNFYADCTDFCIKEFAFHVCVEMIANAITLCEFKTYQNGEPINSNEYWLWNYEPNANQNSAEFLKKLVWKLYADNEVLVFDPRKRNGEDALAVADSYTVTEYISKMNEYRDVSCGALTYSKTFREDDVLHLELNNQNIKAVLNRVNASYERMISAAMDSYAWGKGNHWKVHIGQMATAQQDFQKRFQSMLNEQLKPFFKDGNSVLPEFDGYQFQNVGGDVDRNNTDEVREMVEDVFNYTARAFLIPVVLVNGKVEATSDANQRFLTYCIDPLCRMLEKEIIRKRYGKEDFEKGNYLKIDTSNIIHFDLFANASNVEKIVGSGCFTINDIRKSAGQEPISDSWADEHYLTKNIGEVSTLGES